MPSRNRDVVVVGAGAVGITAAVELASRGASVIVLERGHAPGAGCSSGNAGIVGASKVVPLAVPEAVWEGLRHLVCPNSPFSLRPRPGALPWVARFLIAASRSRDGSTARTLRTLAMESLALHRELGGRLDVGFSEYGVLSVYETPSAFRAACDHVRMADASSPREEILNGRAARELCPSLREEPPGAIFAPDDPHCDPSRFVTALAEEAIGLGVEIAAGVEVLGIRRRGTRARALWTTRGDVPVGDVVLAAGAWSAGLVAGLPVAVPVEGAKGYHIDLAADQADTTIPTLFPERRVVATPLDGRLRLSGVLQLSGTDLRVDTRRVNAIARHASRLLTGIEARRVVDVWRGLRPCSPDGLPIVGPVPGLGNVVLATGHGMWGLQLAPVTARLVADLLTDVPIDGVAQALRPERFRPAPWGWWTAMLRYRRRP